MPPQKCVYASCDWTVPENSKHPVNAMRSHERNIHEGWAEQKRVKPQFLALIEATGGFDLATYFADDVILWNRPSDRELRQWVVEAEFREDAGNPIINQRQIERMERRLRKVQEWKSRQSLDLNRQASNRVAQEVIDTGSTEKPQLVQYLGMNNAYQMKEAAVAYPQQVSKRRRSTSTGAKVIGTKPAPKALPEPSQTVPGEWRVIEGAKSADGDR